MCLIVCITITNAEDYFPERSTNSDSCSSLTASNKQSLLPRQHKETHEQIHHTGIRS